MADTPDADVDDDFSDLYKEYTGPPGTTTSNGQDRTQSNKRSLAGSDEEDEPRDPNAVPTDFTSREAKVWEAKSKATERNWKKRKEEELICKICGESGHFTQGCPSTLGANRKSQDFFERVPARGHVQSLFTEKVIQKIEKDVRCKIKMDEKFIFVSGTDRLILAKGVDAVHKVIKEEGDRRGSPSSHMTISRSPERSTAGPHLGRSEFQRSHSGPKNSSEFQRSHSGTRNSSEFQRSQSGLRNSSDFQKSQSGPRNSSHSQQPRFSRQDKVVENRLRDDLKKFPRDSPQAYGNDRARSHSTHSKSPPRPPYMGNSLSSYDSPQSQSVFGRTGGWDSERRGSELQSSHQFDYPALPQTLEELELEFEKEAMELGRICNKEEDEETYKHRETVREIRENYMKKLASLRGTHAKQWDEFLQLDAQRRQQQARQQMSMSSLAGYKQRNFSEYEGSPANSRFDGTNSASDSRSRYPSHIENYPSRSHDSFGDFQRQRRDGYGKSYNPY